MAQNNDTFLTLAIFICGVIGFILLCAAAFVFYILRYWSDGDGEKIWSDNNGEQEGGIKL
jgi:hypothetical protein